MNVLGVQESILRGLNERTQTPYRVWSFKCEWKLLTKWPKVAHSCLSLWGGNPNRLTTWPQVSHSYNEVILIWYAQLENGKNYQTSAADRLTRDYRTDWLFTSDRLTIGPIDLQPVGDTAVMKESHPYYYQVMMQMAVTGIHKCDFVIYTNMASPVLTVRVSFNKSWWMAAEKKLLDFHEKYIVPALVLLWAGKENVPAWNVD